MHKTLLRSRQVGFGLVALLAAGTTAIAAAPPAGALTPPVLGSAYGYFAKVSIFGSPPLIKGPAVKVTLPKAGSATPILGSAPSGNVTFGPAILVSTGPIAVMTLGTSGNATSSSTLQSVGNSPFTADFVQSLCTAGNAAPIGETTITNGVVVTSTDINENPATTVTIPSEPPPNFTVNGTLTLSARDVESFTWVFNEQIHNKNGSLTVNAAHEILHGPTAKGNVVIGESLCRD